MKTSEHNQAITHNACTENANTSGALFVRQWHKLPPPKALHEQFGVYHGTWSAQLDRYWESNDGYSVSSRQIRTEWGTVEHVTIQRMNGGGDIPWAIKQEIKNELFGNQSTAIEVFPSKRT